MSPEKENGDPVPLIGSIGRSLGDAMRALVRAGGTALAAAFRPDAATRPASSEKSGSYPALALRAIVGGAALRARRRTESPRADLPVSEPDARGASWLDDHGGRLADPVDEDRIVLLPRDPRTVFVYWRLGGAASAAREGSAAGGSEPLRRMLLVEATDDASATMESWMLVLQPRAETCYVDLGKPRRTVRIALGVHAKGGDFLQLVCSAVLSLPEDTRAASEPPRWRRLPFGREGSVDPPAPPTSETSELLCARALECEPGTSAARAWGHHSLQASSDEPVARLR